MEKLLVVVFDNELKAYDGVRALSELDSEGSISIHSKAVIMRDAEQKVIVKQEGDEFPLRTVGGAAIGALIGLLGGPIGLGIGAVSGTLAGGTWDLNRAGVDSEFVDDLSKKLTTAKWAVVADISEEWETPVDVRMAALGGTILRVNRKNVWHERHAREVAVIKADIANLKAEQAKAHAARKAKVQTKIDALNKELDAKVEQAKLRTKQEQEEVKAKVDALKKKAAKARGEAKTKIQKRIADYETRFNESKENWDWLHQDPINQSDSK